MPKVSVVLPTFNRAYALKKSIYSVLMQSYQDFELIVVDDFSQDNTLEIVASFDSEKIKYIKLDRRSGSNHARNVGIKASSGDYVAFQDSDDEWCLNKLEKQIEIIENSKPTVGVVYSLYKKNDGGSEVCIPERNYLYKNGYILDEILKGNFVGTPTVLIKKECFYLAGFFDSELPRLQDWDLFIRVSMYYEFILIQEPLVTAYSYGDSISSNSQAFIESMNIILKRYSFLFKKHKKALSNHYLFLLLFEIDNLNALKKKYLFEAIRSKPLNIRALILLVFGVRRGRTAISKIKKFHYFLNKFIVC